METVENKVLSDLYDKLLLLKYPGVAKATRNEMENVVLAGKNRAFLLSWLLARTLQINREEFIKDLDEATIGEWYSDLGISNDREALMGRISIPDQIYTLDNVIQFIDSVLLVDQPHKADQVDVLDMWKRISENLNDSLETTPLAPKLSHNEALQVLENCRERLNETTACDDKSHETEKNSSTNEATKRNGKKESKTGLCDLEANSETNNWPDMEERTSDFLKSFENVSSWVKSENSDSRSIPSKDMGPCIENIHKNMTTLKETYHSKDRIVNSMAIKPLKREDMPLDSTIANINVVCEERRRLETTD